LEICASGVIANLLKRGIRTLGLVNIEKSNRGGKGRSKRGLTKKGQGVEKESRLESRYCDNVGVGCASRSIQDRPRRRPMSEDWREISNQYTSRSIAVFDSAVCAASGL